MNLKKIKKEMFEVGLITLYFFSCFAIFMVIKKLLLLEHKITFYGWSTAIFGALVMGKIVFMIDKTPLHKWLKRLKPIHEILLKALVYTILVYSFSILEKSVHYWFEEPMLEPWKMHLFGGGKGAVLFAHAIYIYFCFVVFYFFHFLNDEFGRKRIFELLTKIRK